MSGHRRAQRTGFLDVTGRAIREGDRVRGIVDGEIIIGDVCELDADSWQLLNLHGGRSPDLRVFDELEVLT